MRKGTTAFEIDLQRCRRIEALVNMRPSWKRGRKAKRLKGPPRKESKRRSSETKEGSSCKKTDS